MKRITRIVLALILLFVGLGRAKAVSTYTFEDVALNTSTPFSVTENGVTASFSSPADPGAFTITTSFWAPPISGNVLFDPGPSGASSIPLNVSFSQPLASISMDFATDGSGPFNLSAFLGSTFVGTATAAGIIPPGFGFPQGNISFGTATFDKVVLSSPNTPFFAVDNINVTPIPEPSSLALISIAATLASYFGWRRRKKALAFFEG